MRGLSNFSARKAASAIGYTVGTLYNVFGSYDELILRINACTLDEWFEFMQAALEKNGNGNPLHVLARAYVEYGTVHYNQWIALFEHHLSKDKPRPEWYMPKTTRFLGEQLAINDKTTVTDFRKKADGQLEAYGDRFQYLGFEFDGQRRIVRSSTLSRFLRRATYGVRHAKRKAKKVAKNSGSSKVFKRKLYRKFSHLGQNNFIQYVYCADGVIQGNSSIKCQVKKHGSRLQRESKKP